MNRTYRGTVVVFGVVAIVLGLALLVRTATLGGGVGYLFGALFVGLGARPPVSPAPPLVPLQQMPSGFWNAITRRAAASSVAPVATATSAPCVLASLGARAPEARQHPLKRH